MLQPQIFEHKNLYDYLKTLKTKSSGRRGEFSYKQLANRLGYNSPRTVAMAWTGKRPLSKALLSRIRIMAKLSPKEYLYLELLAEKERPGSDKKTEAQHQRELAALAKSYKTQNLAHRIFMLISDWPHATLHQLLQGKKKVSISSLQKKLRGKLSIKEIQSAVDNLLTLGLLKLDPTTNTFLETEENVLVGQEIPSKAIVSYHQQILKLASNALNEQLIIDRDFTSHTLRFSKDQMSAAKQAIRVFVQDFNERFSDLSAEEVYQLNVQFFSQTHPGVQLEEEG